MRWPTCFAVCTICGLPFVEQVSAKSPQEILDEDTAIVYYGTPLISVIEATARRHKLKIELLADVDRYVPVTFDQRGKLTTVFDGLMQQVKLAYAVEEDGIVIHRPGNYHGVPIPVPAKDAEPVLVKALDDMAEFEFSGTPLHVVAEQIQRVHKINIEFATGVSKSSPARYYGRGPLKYELRSLLRPIGLRYSLTRDGIVIEALSSLQSSTQQSVKVLGQSGTSTAVILVPHQSPVRKIDVSQAAEETAGPADSRGTVTYKFAARIKDNGGVAWFKTGTIITGEFTYDIDVQPLSASVAHAKRYVSPRNRVIFEYQDQRFVGTGNTQVKISSLAHSEDFAIRADDLELPSGWVINREGAFDGYGIGLQNVPPRGVLKDAQIPPSLELSQFVTSHELQLSFYHGVTYPQGRVDRAALVRAELESLTRANGDGEQQ